MSIDKLLSQYKTEEELRGYAEASYKTLLQVQKKNKELQDEVDHLKKLVTGAVPIISDGSKPDLSIGSDEEEIAKMELRKLKMDSMGNEPLTLEQAKRVEIYSKILNSRIKTPPNNEREVKELNSDALLAIAESPDETKVN
jgi:hypothetical protein